MADVGQDGKLDQEEFVIAQYFVDSVLRGESLPAFLPKELLPTKAYDFQATVPKENTESTQTRNRAASMPVAPPPKPLPNIPAGEGRSPPIDFGKEVKSSMDQTPSNLPGSDSGTKQMDKTHNQLKDKKKDKKDKKVRKDQDKKDYGTPTEADISFPPSRYGLQQPILSAPPQLPINPPEEPKNPEKLPPPPVLVTPPMLSNTLPK